MARQRRFNYPPAERVCDLCSAPAPWFKYTIRRYEPGIGPHLVLRFCSSECLREWVDGEDRAEVGMPAAEALRLE